LQLVAAFETSGLSGAAFCAQHGLGRSTFNRYRRWQREEQSRVSARWLPVEVAEPETTAPDPSESSLVVRLAHGRRIEVQRGFDALTLQQLLRALESA
jgi:hypothetical protein